MFILMTSQEFIPSVINFMITDAIICFNAALAVLINDQLTGKA